MWILAFSVQHIVDEDIIDETALLGIEAIKQQFREIAQGGEVFLELAERLASHTHRLREDGIETVKKIVKKWRLDAQSPLLKRPEVPLYAPKDPKRRIKGIGAAGAELAGEVDLSGGETNFHLNWVPLVVLIRSRKEGLKGLGWKDYGALNLYEKLHWFKVFGDKVLGVLEVEADDLHTVSTMLSEIQVDFGSGTKVNHARELSGNLRFGAT